MFIKAAPIGASRAAGQGRRRAASTGAVHRRAVVQSHRQQFREDAHGRPLRHARGLQPVAALSRTSICSRSDRPLREAVAANGAGGEAAALAEFGRRWGTAAMFEQARLANENPPKLRTFDTKGFRRDVVEFHPAYHALHGREHARRACTPRPGTPDGTRAAAPAEVARAARYLHGGAGRERAHVPDHHDARLRRRARGRARRCSAQLMPKIASRDYDPSFRPWPEKIRHHARHGHDREAGRHRRARQHHARRAATAMATASPATNGSCRRRCATPSWCWRRRRAG